MPSGYSITDLERLTGIRAFTIRTWEKRYGLLEPHRTDTNIRIYNDDDLRKLLNVNTLLNGGWKISRISALSDQDLESEVWNCARSDRHTDDAYDIYTHALISAALAFDEVWFEATFQESVSRFGLRKVMERIIMPFMYRVGLMWTVMRLHPGQEHFSSNLVRRKLLSAIDQLPGHDIHKCFVLFLPPWEEHEIGLIYASYILREKGWRVIYLGQRVPEEALFQTIDAVSPDALLTFLTAEQDPAIMNSWLESVERHNAALPFGVACSHEKAEKLKLPAAAVVLDGPENFIKWIEQ